MAERIVRDNRRAFKGVWIPAEFYLDPNLSIVEMIVLTEIDSLDNEYGCVASNKHFAEFVGLSKNRASEIISSLKNKGFITIQYSFDDLGQKRRTMRLNRPTRNIEGGNRNIDRPTRNTEPPYSENRLTYSENREGYSENRDCRNTSKNTARNTSIGIQLASSANATQREYIQRGATATSRTADDDAGRQNPTGQSLANAGATASVAQYQQSADQAQPVRSQNQTTRDQQATPMTADDDNDKPTEMEMVFACWREAWGEPRKSTLDDLVAWSTEFEPQLVVLAIRKAVEANADYPDRYIAAVMRGYRTAGIKGYDDAIAADEARKNRHTTQRFNGRQNGRRANVQETLPAWAEPGYKPQVKKPSAEQQDEFKAMMAGMDLESRLRKAVQNRQKLEDADVQATRTNLSQPNGHGYMSVDAPKLFEQYLAQQGQGA